MKEDKIFTFSENSLEKELASLEKEKIRQVRVSQKSITENKQKLLRFVSLAEKIAPEVLYQFEIPLSMIDRETVAAFSSIYSSLDIEFDSVEGNFSKNLSIKTPHTSYFILKLYHAVTEIARSSLCFYNYFYWQFIAFYFCANTAACFLSDFALLLGKNLKVKGHTAPANITTAKYLIAFDA